MLQEFSDRGTFFMFDEGTMAVRAEKDIVYKLEPQMPKDDLDGVWLLDSFLAKRGFVLVILLE
jgi:hypothetical protein